MGWQILPMTERTAPGLHEILESSTGLRPAPAWMELLTRRIGLWPARHRVAEPANQLISSPDHLFDGKNQVFSAGHVWQQDVIRLLTRRITSLRKTYHVCQRDV